MSVQLKGIFSGLPGVPSDLPEALDHMKDADLQNLAHRLASNHEGRVAADPKPIFDLLKAFKKTRNELKKALDASMVDFLTGVSSRRHFDKTLQGVIGQVNRSKLEREKDKLRHMPERRPETPTRYLFIFFDLNQFKPINDTYGHQVGDAALHDFAQTLRRVVRNGEECARLGGDEFGVIIADTTGNERFITGARKRFRKALIPFYFEYNGKRYPLTSSYGVCEIKPGMTAQQVYDVADHKAMKMKRRLGIKREGAAPQPVIENSLDPS